MVFNFDHVYRFGLYIIYLVLIVLGEGKLTKLPGKSLFTPVISNMFLCDGIREREAHITKRACIG